MRRSRPSLRSASRGAQESVDGKTANFGRGSEMQVPLEDPLEKDRDVRLMTAIKGAAVALTGAASGIGRALAFELAARGADLALADIDEPQLTALANELRQTHQVNISVHRADVAQDDEISRFAEAAIRQHPRLNVLINNAGVALQGWFEEMTLAEFEWVMSVNFWGVVRGTHHFLPHLQAQPAAHIVNISSVFGLIAPVGQTADLASNLPCVVSPNCYGTSLRPRTCA